MPRKLRRPPVPDAAPRPLLAAFDDDNQRRTAGQLHLASVFPSWPGETGVPDVIRLTDSADGYTIQLQIDARYYETFPHIVDERMTWLAYTLRTSPHAFNDGSQAALQPTIPPSILYTVRPDAPLGITSTSYPLQSLLCAAGNLHLQFIDDTERLRSPRGSGVLTLEGGRRWIEAFYRGEGDAALQVIFKAEWLTKWPYERGDR